VRFLDERSAPLAPVPRNFPRIVRIEKSPRIFAPEIIAVSDVRIPLLGPNGASRTYGPQKGATSEMVETLERDLARFADIVARDLHCDFRATPGAGAAGGLGFGLLSFCQATIRSGFETFAEMMELDRLIRDVDLVVTGEGQLDPQTLDGKGPGASRSAQERPESPSSPSPAASAAKTNSRNISTPASPSRTAR